MRTEKSLAVESMHRMAKHFKDVVDGKVETLSDEVIELMDVWQNREFFEGLDVNAALAKIRQIRAGGPLPGWKPLGRRGFTL